MAAEYLGNAVQAVDLNTPVILDASIPCNRGYIWHENGTGIFILRGITQNQCYATYQIAFNANIALPEDAADIVPIAIGIAVNGEPRLTSRAIYTPQAVNEYGNVTSVAIIKVPKGCCFNVSIDAVSGITADPTATPAPVINVQNANLTIDRIA
jgi:hypothetical protein